VIELRACLVFVVCIALAGCIERQELREQHCARLAIERHGYRLPVGVYGTWTRGAQCYVRLWDHTLVREGEVE